MSDFPPDELAARRTKRDSAILGMGAIGRDALARHLGWANEPPSASPNCRRVMPPLTRRERVSAWWRDARGMILPMAVGLALGLGLVIAVYVVR
jgi:hypothetical protein